MVAYAKANPVDGAPLNLRTAALQVSKVERQAVKDHRASGSKAKAPATPVTDAINAAGSVVKFVGSAAAARSGAAGPRVGIDFYRNGTLVTSPQNVIYHGTKCIAPEGRARLTASEFWSFLESEHGIQDPQHSAWSITLPNGVRLAAKVRKG